jgi:hypothetical membrane protein
MYAERTLLRLAFLGPLLYFAAVIAGSLFYPGYSQATQYASELGAAQAPHPEIFNDGIIAGGVLGVIGALGFFLALARTGRWLAALLAALSVALWGASMIMGGMFPMPDERHGGFGVGMAVQLAPLFFLWALWGERGRGGLKAFLLLDFLAMTAGFLVMMGIGQLVTHANVGLWQRAYALAMMPWMSIVAWALLARPVKGRRGAAAHPALAAATAG